MRMIDWKPAIGAGLIILLTALVGCPPSWQATREGISVETLEQMAMGTIIYSGAPGLPAPPPKLPDFEWLPLPQRDEQEAGADETAPPDDPWGPDAAAPDAESAASGSDSPPSEEEPSLVLPEGVTRDQVLVGVATDLEMALNQLAVLEDRVRRLEQSTDRLMTSALGKVQSENEMLRLEIQRMDRLLAGQGSRQTAPFMPPTAQPVGPTQPVGPAQPAQSIQPSQPAQPADANPVPPQEPRPVSAFVTENADTVPYTVIKEWGCTPEEAAQSGGRVTSRKGMVCAVDPNITDSDLITMGRILHGRFDGYENITIEVFDDAAAAKRYIEENAAPGDHRVLFIMKQPLSNRDAIVLMRDGREQMIPH